MTWALAALGLGAVLLTGWRARQPNRSTLPPASSGPKPEATAEDGKTDPALDLALALAASLASRLTSATGVELASLPARQRWDRSLERLPEIRSFDAWRREGGSPDSLSPVARAAFLEVDASLTSAGLPEVFHPFLAPDAEARDWRLPQDLQSRVLIQLHDLGELDAVHLTGLAAASARELDAAFRGLEDLEAQLEGRGAGPGPEGARADEALERLVRISREADAQLLLRTKRRRGLWVWLRTLTLDLDEGDLVARILRPHQRRYERSLALALQALEDGEASARLLDLHLIARQHTRALQTTHLVHGWISRYLVGGRSVAAWDLQLWMLMEVQDLANHSSQEVQDRLLASLLQRLAAPPQAATSSGLHADLLDLARLRLAPRDSREQQARVDAVLTGFAGRRAGPRWLRSLLARAALGRLDASWEERLEARALVPARKSLHATRHPFERWAARKVLGKFPDPGETPEH